MTQYGNLEQLRQRNIASIVNAAGTMADINRGESAADLADAQERRLRAVEPFLTQREQAEIEKLQLDVDKLRATNPYAVETIQAENKLREAQARALNRQTDFAKATENIDKELLAEKLAEAQRNNVETFEMPDGKGGTIKLTRKEGFDYLRAIPDSRGGERGITDYQRTQIDRQRERDLEADDKVTADAEHSITNDLNKNQQANIDIFNTRSRKGYVYVPKETTGAAFGIPGLGNKITQGKKVPLPRVKDVTGADKQLTAREFWIMFNDPEQNPGLNLEEFARYYYTNTLQKPLPKELQ